ncbi:MAG TPA: hypothetical protein VFE58_17890 [Tepidisphaeraceae bacterium]|jgi:hypothetical protein|nr:hypothetical protein [Tepidisphaeraceae bacterium]
MADEVVKEEVVVESPPAAPRGVKEEGADGPRVRLHQLAERLTRGRSRQVFAEYLQLRRSLM